MRQRQELAWRNLVESDGYVTERFPLLLAPVHILQQRPTRHQVRPSSWLAVHHLDLSLNTSPSQRQ